MKRKALIFGIKGLSLSKEESKLLRKMKTFTIKYNNAGNDLIRPSLTINLKPKPN